MRFQVAFVGAGWVVREVWLPRFARHPAFEVAGLVDPDPEAVGRAAARWPEVVRAYPDLASLIADAPDLTVVASPNSQHAKTAAALLSRGLHVFIEKPVCLSLDEVGHLRAAAANGGRLYPSRASCLRGDVAALADLVGSGRVGTPRRLELVWLRAGGVPRYGSWFTSKAESGGGAGLDLGWHLLSAGLAILGPRRPGAGLAVSSSDHLAAAATAAWRGDTALREEKPVDVEDTLSAFFVWDGPVAVSLHAAWASPVVTDTTRVTLHGSRGVAELTTTFGFSPNRVDTPTLSLLEAGGRRVIEVPLEAPGAEYDRQVDRLAQLSAGARPFDQALALDEVETIVASLGQAYGTCPTTAGVRPAVPDRR